MLNKLQVFTKSLYLCNINENKLIIMQQTLQAGSLLQQGRYSILRVLGQGGFGITYEGVQAGLNRRVAIKEFFMKDFCERQGQQTIVTGTENVRESVAQYKTKFIKEAQMIAALDHVPHMVSIHDIFEENQTAYYVMDFVDGGSLRQLVEQEGPLDEARAVNLVCQVGEALARLHQHQVMHLDVKPDNILLRQGDDDVVLIDFGVSKHYDQRGSATTVTPVGYSKGFAPVEQYREGGVDRFSPATDVYSLGATLYYLLAGEVPPEATNLIDDQLTRPIGVSDRTWKVVERAMQSSRKARFQSVKEMMSALDEQPAMASTANLGGHAPKSANTLQHDDNKTVARSADDNRTVAQQPIDVPVEERHRRVWPWVAGVLVIGIVVAIFVLKKKSQAPEDIYQQGMAYFNQQDYEQAFPLLMEAAEAGYDSAQHKIGYLYDTGLGGNKDDNEAVRWYQRAVEQGLAISMNNLGGMYEDGRGVPRDWEESFRLRRLSAESGDPIGQYNLARMYANGIGVASDYDEAMKWYGKAEAKFREKASEGDAQSQYFLGIMYLYGEGVAIDYAEAVYWFRQAADGGHHLAQYFLGCMYLDGEGVTRDEAEGAMWIRKAAEKNLAAAQFDLGVLYANGRGVETDEAEAAKWWTKAAEQGMPEAQRYLGVLYENGWGVEQNRSKAVDYYRQAAQQGDSISIYNLWELDETY